MAKKIGATALSITCAVALAGLSRLPYDATSRTLPSIAGLLTPSSDAPDPSDAPRGMGSRSEEVGALIRLSWRTTSERVEECRRLSEEELAALPVHMRREEVCEGRMLPYRLHVSLGDRIVIDEVVQPAGARGDRPLYVFHELAIPAGEQELTVRWERVEDRAEREEREEREGSGQRGGDNDRSAARTSQDERDPDEGTPAALAIRAMLALEPRDVALITYDVDLRSLVARGRGIVDFESTTGRSSPDLPDPDEPGPDARERDTGDSDRDRDDTPRDVRER